MSELLMDPSDPDPADKSLSSQYVALVFLGSFGVDVDFVDTPELDSNRGGSNASLLCRVESDGILIGDDVYVDDADSSDFEGCFLYHVEATEARGLRRAGIQ